MSGQWGTRVWGGAGLSPQPVLTSRPRLVHMFVNLSIEKGQRRFVILISRRVVYYLQFRDEVSRQLLHDEVVWVVWAFRTTMVQIILYNKGIAFRTVTTKA